MTLQPLPDFLASRLSPAFRELGLPPELAVVHPSSRPDLGQFQCNGAFAAAKTLRRSPLAIAEDIAARIQAADEGVFQQVQAVNPGFINLSLTPEYLARRCAGLVGDARAGVPMKSAPQRVVMDYGGANVAKALHIGHLRSPVIGEALRRIFLFAGDTVITDVHLGDWGTQMGQLIEEVRLMQPDLLYFDGASDGPYPATSPVTVEELGEIYPRASARYKEDEAFARAARQATAELQQGRPGYRALWRHFVDVSLAALRRDYGDLGIHFDLWLGESDAQPAIPPMIESLQKAGASVMDQGAVIIPLPAELNLPPMILVKSDGGVMYATTDLATIKQRVEDLQADLILYVVDDRQADHFRQVFAVATQTGLSRGVPCEHIMFGTVNGPDGKPFRTREGGTIQLRDILDMVVAAAKSRIRERPLSEDMSADEKERIARMVGLAALKYADLSNQRTGDYVFSPKNVTAFEGNTGPYLLYTAVRIRSLLRRAEAKNLRPGPILPAASEVETALQLKLQHLPGTIATAYDKRYPHLLCAFAYELAQTYAAFYNQHHILQEADAARQQSWLQLCALSLTQLELVLNLLGIDVPERM